MKGKLQTLGLQAQPCYKSVLKSLFDLLGKFLHLFCKNRNEVLECSIFGLVVHDGCRGGDDSSGSRRWGRDRTSGGSTLHSRLSLKMDKAYPRKVTSVATVVTD
jgi:hypothetical protein